MKPITYIICVLFSSLVWAQEGVALRLSRNEIKLAEQFELSYVLKSASDSSYQLHLKDGNLPIINVNPEDKKEYTLEIIKKTFDSNYVKNDTFFVYKSYILTSWETGDFIIPPLVFKGKTDSLFSFPEQLRVNRVQIDTTKDIKPIKPIILEEGAAIKKEETLEKTVFWWVISIIVTLLIIAAIVTWILIKKRRHQVVQKIELTPDQLALKDLEKLKQELASGVDSKSYYIELTRILRSYIESRYRIPTFEKTSRQILKSLKSKEIESISFKELEHIFELSDLVKFAKKEPSFEDHNHVHQLVVNFINKTKSFFHFNEA